MCTLGGPRVGHERFRKVERMDPRLPTDTQERRKSPRGSPRLRATSTAVMLERMPAAGRAVLDLEQRPILVFWETTKACGLACRHCRASAISQPLRGELKTAHGAPFVDSLAGF